MDGGCRSWVGVKRRIMLEKKPMKLNNRHPPQHTQHAHSTGLQIVIKQNKKDNEDNNITIMSFFLLNGTFEMFFIVKSRE